MSFELYQLLIFLRRVSFDTIIGFGLRPLPVLAVMFVLGLLSMGPPIRWQGGVSDADSFTDSNTAPMRFSLCSMGMLLLCWRLK